MSLKERKGAKRIAEIPAEVLWQLEHAELETANLVEWLAIDQAKLAKHVFERENWPITTSEVRNALDQVAKPSVNTRNEALGRLILEKSANDPELIKKAIHHRADMVRNWACYAIALNHELSFEEKLNAILPLADDLHFGVREVAWMALRPALALDLPNGLQLLSPLTKRPEAGLRRFASEISRPRGVWCTHIQTLKENPELGLPILLPLMKDESRYVQDSVANWLNDASKSKPEWVLDFCRSWERPDMLASTGYILKRARRSL